MSEERRTAAVERLAAYRTTGFALLAEFERDMLVRGPRLD